MRSKSPHQKKQNCQLFGKDISNEDNSKIIQNTSETKCLQNLQILLNEEICLEGCNIQQNFKEKDILFQVFGLQLNQCLSQIQIEQSKLQKIKDEQVYTDFVENSINKLIELNEKVTKIKQFFLYCKILKRPSIQLENSIEKYFQFAKIQSSLNSELGLYLKDPIISDIIFKQYLRIYNVNIFTSDLISHYFWQNQNGLLKFIDNKQFQAQRIPELILLEKKNIVFKQLYDINEKYTQIQNQIKHSYISNIIQIIDQHTRIQQYYDENKFSQNQIQQKKKQDNFTVYNEILSQKLQNLTYLIGKMSMIGKNLFQDSQSQEKGILVNEYENNYKILKNHISFSGYQNDANYEKQYSTFLSQIFKPTKKQKEEMNLKMFFDENVEYNQFSQINENLKQNNNREEQFDFLKQKIIKTQTLVVLNKIFSTFNLLSYFMQQLNQNPGKQTQFTFTSLSKHIEEDFRTEFIVQEQQKNEQKTKKNKSKNNGKKHHHLNVFIQSDDFGNWMILSGTQKLIYPSAIHSLIELLKYVIKVAGNLKKKSLFSGELMFQILSLKAEQISKSGQIIHNIYNVIKSKQVNCYKILNKYLKIILEGFFNYQLQWVSKLDLSLEEENIFKKQLEQLEILNNNFEIGQPNYENDRNNYLNEKQRVLNEMKNMKISKFLTFYAEKAKKADFLSQIIYQLDTNYQVLPVLEELLKCEEHHQKTFYFQDNSQFYQTVLYEIIQMRNHIKLDHFYTLPRLHEIFGFFTTKAVSFGSILNELAKYSTSSIRISELLTFFKTQLKLKRLVFRGQLYWISYKNFAQNIKQKNFKDFVEQEAQAIISLSEESMEYFLNNIQDFVKKTNYFEEQIERLKFFQLVCGKSKYSKIKVKDIQNHLKCLNYSQLKSIYEFMCHQNPIVQILKGENMIDQILSDIKLSIQLNNKIRYEDISRSTTLIKQKKSLAENLFFIKAFGFQLCYMDCLNIVLPKRNKFLNEEDQRLKLAVNRQKANIIKHYDQILFEDKKNIHFTICFYQRLLLISLLEIKDQISYQNDKLLIQHLLNNIPFNINIISQVQKIKLSLFNYQESSSDFSQIYNLLKVKKNLKELECNIHKITFNEQAQLVDYNTVEGICLISKLSKYTQKKIVQKIQQINQEVIEKQTLNNNKKIIKQLSYLNIKLQKYFLHLLSTQLIGKINLDQQNLDSKSCNIYDVLIHIQNQLKHKISLQISRKSLIYESKEELYLFDEFCGYKVKKDSDQSPLTNNRSKDMRRNDRKNIKKGLFSPVRSPNFAQSNIMQNIQKRVGIEMIKQSMNLRKIISNLQLEDKQMRDQIAWQTSKLEHNVINKIHAFITESNIDQEQSYINFKYTVNLQTIKGMQNVIKEQTQLAMKTSEEKIRQRINQEVKPSKNDNSDFFLTNPNSKIISPDDEQSKIGYQNSRMLNTNIELIFNHMKKIRVFAAWKKTHRNMDLTNEQWCNFNKNVSKILHNERNIKKIQKINNKRNECFKQNILCSLLKQQNQILSQKIKANKLQTLSKTIENYRHKINENS